jgi:hypothetical protein
MSPKSPLQKQLEEQKFLHGVSYVKQAAGGIKKLSSSELAHLNAMLTEQKDEPWRLNPAQVQIPSGHVQHFNIVSNPINRAREIIGHAMDMASNEHPLEAASYLYSQLVLEHLFNDANRRTAVLATLWLLLANSIDVDVDDLLKVPVGNLRNKKDLDTLANQLRALSKS